MLNFNDKLPPEVEEGNIEYKLKLMKPSKLRMEHLVTQMNWRLREGNGEAIYELGVQDQGYFAGLSFEEMEESKATLASMAHQLGASLQVLREKILTDYDINNNIIPCSNGINNEPDLNDIKFDRNKYVCEILVRKVSDDQPFIDLRVAVLGNHGSGKSTLIGVLTRGEHDDGQGKARLNLLRHAHEIESGRTSCISIDVVGYNDTGQTVNYSGRRTIEEIFENSTKLITFLDLAGFYKYQKTTMFGLTTYAPDFVMLVVDSSCGLVGTSKEHLGFAVALNLPIFIVVTKVDVGTTTGSLSRTLESLEVVLTSLECVKVPFRVRSKDQAITAAFNLARGNVVPIVQVSNVTGEGLDILHNFLQVLPPPPSYPNVQLPMNFLKSSRSSASAEALGDPSADFAEFQVDETFTIEGLEGVVVSGIMSRGMVLEGDTMLVGPYDDATFHPVHVRSIHRCRMIRKCIRAGDCATLALTLDPAQSKLRKGMVLLDPEVDPRACSTFTAEIHVLFHATSITPGFQTTVHVRNVRQTAIIEHLNKPCLKTGQSGTATFRFIKQPVYLSVGSKLIIREGTTKGIGHVSTTQDLQASGWPASEPNTTTHHAKKHHPNHRVKKAKTKEATGPPESDDFFHFFASEFSYD